jgi:hypothetical protein
MKQLNAPKSELRLVELVQGAKPVNSSEKKISQEIQEDEEKETDCKYSFRLK